MGNPHQQQYQQQQRASYDYEDDSSTGYDTRSSGEYEYGPYQHHPSRTNGVGGAVGGGSGGSRGGGGYSVSGSHDYLGYPKDQQPFDSQNGLWDDEEKRELW